MIAILAVGATLAGLALTSVRGTETRLRQDMTRMESRLESQINDLRGEVGKLRERMSHLDGLLEGIVRGPDRTGRCRLEKRRREYVVSARRTVTWASARMSM